MKRIIFLCLLASCLYACNLLGKPELSEEEGNLPRFIIGKWEGTEYRPEGNGNLVQFTLEFVDSDTLYYDFRSTYERYLNIEYHYSFIDINKIQVKEIGGRLLVEEWTVERDNEYLKVNWLPNEEYIVFHRKKTTHWVGWSLFLGLLMIGTIISYLKGFCFTFDKNTRKISSPEDVNRYQKSVRVVMLSVFAFAMFVLGVFTAHYVDSIEFLYIQIRPPWYYIIHMEVSIILLVLGLIFARSIERIGLKPISPILRTGRFSLGVLLISVGFYGIFMTLIRLALTLILRINK